MRNAEVLDVNEGFFLAAESVPPGESSHLIITCIAQEIISIGFLIRT
jgi:hypothetical protein